MPTDEVIGRAARDRLLVARQLGACRAAIAPPATPEQAAGLMFSRGDRVLHSSTGQQGEIIRGERRASLAPTPQSFGV